MSLIKADGTLHPQTGRIVFLDRAVDVKTGTLRVRAQFPNPEKILRPGMFGRIRVDLGVRKDSILVPERAVAELARAGAGVNRPAGGFYLYLDFTPLAGVLANGGLVTSPALCEYLLVQAGVALLPGTAFGHQAEQLTARLAFVDFDGAAALELLGRMASGEAAARQVAASACGRVTAGVKALAAHLH